MNINKYAKALLFAVVGMVVSIFLYAHAAQAAGEPGTFTLWSDMPVCDRTEPIGPAVRLHWTHSEGVTSYHVYRNGLYYVKVNLDETFYNSANVTAGNTYTYFIVAENANGTTRSNTISLNIPANICAEGTGILNVDSVPAGATVYIDNVDKGVTPITVNDLSAGGHPIRITKSGYQEYQGTVSVIAGASTGFGVSLTPLTPACRDGIDNDGDGATDAADCGCHTDGVASNAESYNPEDTGEGGFCDSSGGGGGGGIGTGSVDLIVHVDLPSFTPAKGEVSHIIIANEGTLDCRAMIDIPTGQWPRTWDILVPSLATPEIVWDGRDGNGHIVPAGNYIYTATCSAIGGGFSDTETGVITILGESDTQAPVLSQVKPVENPTTDTTPDYMFHSSEAGTISYSGDCTSYIISAMAGVNTITFSDLADGVHSNCTIRVIDEAGNMSNPLMVSSFEVRTQSTPIPTHKVAVIPVRYNSDPAPIHTVEELKQKAQLVKEYYQKQSYGAVNIQFDFVFDDWKSLEKNFSDYIAGDLGFFEKRYLVKKWSKGMHQIVNDGIGLATEKTLDSYDTILVIQPACTQSFANGFGGREVFLTEKDLYGVWAHELGHSIFSFADYYASSGYALSHGDIHYWGLMGMSPLTNPVAPIISPNKEKAGWLTYNMLGNKAYGHYNVENPSTMKLHDRILAHDISEGDTDFYVFEKRFPDDDIPRDPYEPSGGYCNDGVSYKLKKEQGIELYKVMNKKNSITGWPFIYSVPRQVLFTLPYVMKEPEDKVTLTDGSEYIDDQAAVKYKSVEENGQLKLAVEENIPLGRKILSFVSESEQFFDDIFKNPVNTRNAFDVNLYAIDPDGNRIGVDAEGTGYENRIKDARSSGNILGGGPEWVSVPNDDLVYYGVDLLPAKKWAEETGNNIEDIQASLKVVSYDESGNKTSTEQEPVTLGINDSGLIGVMANVYFNPNTLNVKSKGKWITAYIELPDNFDVHEIDTSSIAIGQDTKIIADRRYGFVKNLSIGDFNNNGKADLMVKIDRGAISNIAGLKEDGKLNLQVAGFVKRDNISIPFVGKGEIKILHQ